MKCPRCNREMIAVTARDPERAWFCKFCMKHRDKSEMANWDGSTEGDDAECGPEVPDTSATKEKI